MIIISLTVCGFEEKEFDSLAAELSQYITNLHPPLKSTKSIGPRYDSSEWKK